VRDAALDVASRALARRAGLALPTAETERALELDEATSLGVSANELFSWVSGEHRESLFWDGFAPNPEELRAEITLQIEALGEIDSVPVRRANEVAASTHALGACSSRRARRGSSIGVGVQLSS